MKKAVISNWVADPTLINQANFITSLFQMNNTGYFGKLYTVKRLHWPTKKYFFQNEIEIYTYSGAEWCPKYDVAFSFPLK